MHLKMSSAEVVWCKYLPSITDKLSIEANSLDPEQTAPIGAVWTGSTLFAIEASLTFQQTRKSDDFCCDWRIKGQGSLWQIVSLEVQMIVCFRIVLCGRVCAIC